MRNPYPYPPVTFGDSPLVGALRKHAGGMFLATDRSGYAARREDVGVLGSLIMLIVPTRRAMQRGTDCHSASPLSQLR